MAISEAKKRADKKWQTEKCSLVSIKLSKEKANQFRHITERMGMTRHQVLVEFVNEFIEKHRELLNDYNPDDQ